jgi:hypothetical protein
MRATRMTAPVILGAALILAGCGSSPSALPSATGSTTPTIPSAIPSIGLPSTPGASDAAGSGAPVETDAAGTDAAGSASPEVVQRDLPPIVDGAWTNGTLHIDVTGGRTESFDLPGGAIAAGGASILTFGDASGDRTVQATISGTDPSGFTLVTPDLLAAGMWGGDCQLKVTRNEAAGIAGEFSCPTITGGNPKATETVPVSISGKFSATH